MIVFFTPFPVIEQYTENTRFCIICNYLSKIIPALQSRCTRFRFGPLAMDQMMPRLEHIITEEKWVGLFCKASAGVLLSRIRKWSSVINSLRTSDAYIYASVKYTIIGSDNGLLPVRQQPIICTNDGFVVNYTPRNKFQWKFICNSNVLIHENAYENVSCENCGHLVSATMCYIVVGLVYVVNEPHWFLYWPSSLTQYKDVILPV